MASRWNSGVSIILLFSFPELLLSAVVTLDSLEIYKNHEWLGSKPKVYFQCSGEKKAALPDVKKTYTVYKFKGEESFQPLTEFSSKKCKRCGFYEEEHIKFDDVFDEWEFCPSDFAASDGRYIRTVDKEFNATFLCHECIKHDETTNLDSDSHPHEEGHGMQWTIIIIVISVAASAIFVAGLVVAYKYWQKRKRQQEQARFLKLFEDTDDVEDELGIDSI
ncbi:uncharacterized protein LOC112519220 [Cynara cardunculus var. scolymus]|uniref:uncharacterized protein LOC112519220 n=1 Tax=Cynara cardunculus var. scolymus TaxID=59895 RepID=UPI000D62CA10|nr:uncharacterized protein LOC112519220 [Cynara cardunculus var. scolymus]